MIKDFLAVNFFCIEHPAAKQLERQHEKLSVRLLQLIPFVMPYCSAPHTFHGPGRVHSLQETPSIGIASPPCINSEPFGPRVIATFSACRCSSAAHSIGDSLPVRLLPLPITEKQVHRPSTSDQISSRAIRPQERVRGRQATLRPCFRASSIAR